MSQATGPYRNDHIFHYLARKLRRSSLPFVQQGGPTPQITGPVLVALSGGADSVFLLHFLLWLSPPSSTHQGKAPVVAAHARHGLRESDGQDEQFCRKLCHSLNVPLRLGQLHTPQNRRPGESAEMAARRLRYNFLLEKGQGFSAVALGHHAQDQLETLLLRLGEGTGPRGLAAMEAYSPPYWRPLLPVKKEEITAFLQANAIPWLEDPSNSDPQHLRNRIRPAASRLIEIFPRLGDNLEHTTKLLHRQEKWLARQAQKWLRHNSLSSGHSSPDEETSPSLCLYAQALRQEEEPFGQKILEQAVLYLDSHFQWNRRTWAALFAALRRLSVAEADEQGPFAPDKSWCPGQTPSPQARRHPLWRKGNITMELWRPEPAAPWLLLLSLAPNDPKQTDTAQSPWGGTARKPPVWRLAESRPGRLVFVCPPPGTDTGQEDHGQSLSPCQWYQRGQVELALPQAYDQPHKWRLVPWADLQGHGLSFAVEAKGDDGLYKSQERKLNKIIKNSLARPWRPWLPVLLYRDEAVALLYSLLPGPPSTDRFSAKLKRLTPPLIISIP